MARRQDILSQVSHYCTETEKVDQTCFRKSSNLNLFNGLKARGFLALQPDLQLWLAGGVAKKSKGTIVHKTQDTTLGEDKPLTSSDQL